MFKHSKFFMKKCSLTVDFVKFVFKWKMFEHVELLELSWGVFEWQLCVLARQARLMFLIVSCCLLAEIGHIVQYIFFIWNIRCTGHLNNRKLLMEATANCLHECIYCRSSVIVLFSLFANTEKDICIYITKFNFLALFMHIQAYMIPLTVQFKSG